MADASTAIVRVTPISGCRQDGAPFCYLLEIDQARILLDIGTTSAFPTQHFSTLKRLTKTLDLILLSHGDLAHSGGLPQLLASMDVPCPVLATVPVHHLGLVTLYDAYQSHFEATGTAPAGLSLDDIDAAFERTTILRYAQPYTVATGPAMGIQVTPVAAGHSLGGAIWRIRRHTEDIFYAMDFNHKREMHLDGAALDVVQRPTLLIADAKGALDVHGTRKERDSDLINTMTTALKAGGTVLIPVDTAARCLELLQVIESYWSNPSTGVTSPVVFLSHQSQRVIDLVKGMLEWMGLTLAKVFEHDRTNPFDFKNIRLCHNIDEVASITGPKVILATMDSFDSGMSRVLLPSILGASNSCIILPTTSHPSGLAARFLSASKGSMMTVEYSEKVPLEGDELHRHRQQQREDVERKAAEEAFALLQREEEEMDDEDDEDDQIINDRRIESMNQKIQDAAALQQVYWTDYRTDWFVDESSVAGKVLRNAGDSPFYPMIPPSELAAGGLVRYQVFPFKEKRCVSDAYGEHYDPADFNIMNKNLRTSESTLTGIADLSIVEDTVDTKNKIVKEEHPTKWVSVTKQVAIKCHRKFIDFSGISDGRSLKTIYSRIQAKRIVFVGGSSEATDYLYNHFALQQLQNVNKMSQVYAPHLGETVTVSSAVNVLQATLSESLIAMLRLQHLGGYELARVYGSVQCREDGEHVDGMNMSVDKETGMNIDREAIVLVPAIVNDESVVPVLLGSDVKLNEVRRMVQQELKISAEFINGELICGTGDKRVRVKRKSLEEGDGISLEGPICREYFSIRALLYSTTAFLQ